MKRFDTECFLGEISIVAFGFAPKGWSTCDGQLLSISQNQALYALLGTTFGGDGINTFKLPDYRGRMPIGTGKGAGLSTYVPGQISGSEKVALLNSQMPLHTAGDLKMKVGGAANTNLPQGNYIAKNTVLATRFSDRDDTQSPQVINSPAIATGQPHENMMPSLVLNFIIAIQGLYPSRS